MGDPTKELVEYTISETKKALASHYESLIAELTDKMVEIARARLAALEAALAGAVEVDRLAGIASRSHWFGPNAVDEYEDTNDLFQDLDNARAKNRDAIRALAQQEPTP